MKKFGFYAAALAFCVLLVGVVAVSSPIEADAMDTLGHSNAHIRTGSVPIDLIEGETVEYQFWSVDSSGNIRGSNTVPESGGYIKAEVDGGKITLTLNNVKVNPGVPFALDMGNANVELRLVGDNILNSTDYWPAIYVTSEDEYKSESNLTITGSGSLTCYGNGNSVGAAVYAGYNLTVTGGAELYAYADEADADAAGSGNGGTARAGDTTSKHGLFAGGSLTVESGSVVEGVGGKLNNATDSVDCSDGVHVNGSITVKSGGSLKGTGSEVNGTDGNMFIRGIYSGGSITVEEDAAATGLGGNITSAANGYLESYGVYAGGAITEGAIDVDGTLTGTGGDVTSTGGGSSSSCGVAAAESSSDDVPCSFSGRVTAEGGEIIEGSGDSCGLRLSSGLDIEAGAVVSAIGGETANGSSYGADVIEDVSVAGQFTASAGDAESLNGSYSCGLYVMFSNSSVTVDSTGRLIASGGKANCKGGMGSTSAGLWTLNNSVTVDGYAELTGGNATVTDGAATADSYGLFASDVAVTGELVAKSGEAVSNVEDEKDKSAAYSAGIWTGDMSIAERAEVEATSGKAQSDGSETISAGVYLDPANSDGLSEDLTRPDNPGGSGSSGNGGEEETAVCSLTVDGSLSATGGEAVGEHAVSAGVRFPEPEYYEAAGFTVGETGSVTATGVSAVGDNSESFGVSYHGPATINGELTAEGGEASLSAGLSIETISVKGVLTAASVNGDTGSSAQGVHGANMLVEKGAHVIADVTGAGAEEKTALLLYAEDTSSLTLPSDYRWRTSSDGEFTLYSVTPYEYEFDGDDWSKNDSYVEIAPVEVPATGVTLSESSLVLDVGETAQLTAAVVPEATTDKLVWSSADESVATVDANGLVTAVGPGRTVITAAAGSVSAECSVTVRGGSVDVGPTYEIELDEGIVGGEIKTSLTNASAGSTIRVTATPDAGYELAYITVDGERIPGTSFTMPAHDVTVSAVFTRGE
ncbi:MAG TPA: Ig domain-containing protein, partial [Candidatus Scatomorpha merdipullorum]|nr:Ig domain-containing protein [Candidatus Scatomorpha merdipullorum]